MRTFVIGGMAAVLGLAFAGRADAQVIGTYGTSGAPLGYYSPYPGPLYSPFRQPTPMYNPGFYPAYNGGPYYQPGFYPAYNGNGNAMPRYYNPPVYQQQYGYGQHPGGMYNRRR